MVQISMTKVGVNDELNHERSPNKKHRQETDAEISPRISKERRQEGR